MYVEKNSTAERRDLIAKNASPLDDIEYLKVYYQQHGNFPMFTQVLLETRTDCNRSCKFCPQSHFVRPLKVMEWEVFTKVINELSAIDFGGRIAFYMTNEPLLETRLLDMIKYARSKSARFFLDITSNGKNLSSKQVDEFFIAGLDNININDYRNDREKFPNKISQYLESIASDFKSNPKVTYIKRSTKEILSNYAGTILGAKRKLQSSFCNYPFRKLSISADGNVILCCNDYTYKTNFGNVMEKSLKEIWFTDEINQYRSNLLNELRSGICEDCDEFQNYSVFT
jgi:radical SAM protein with 4Fe4S-binding SPASM domain|tara:strand:- start:558 stop:1412 length:855 start_codon:yes stop_codon:yes gene_type:complete